MECQHRRNLLRLVDNLHPLGHSLLQHLGWWPGGSVLDECRLPAKRFCPCRPLGWFSRGEALSVGVGL
jgi:hypothetical protein